MIAWKNKRNNSSAGEAKWKNKNCKYKINLYCRYGEMLLNVSKGSAFEEKVELDLELLFIRLADWDHDADVERGLDWISECKQNVYVSMQSECLCGHGMGVWRRVSLQQIYLLGHLTKLTVVILRPWQAMTAVTC